MYTPNEVETHVQSAWLCHDRGNTERAALIAQMAQAEALCMIAEQLIRLNALLENVVDTAACCIVTRPADF